MNIKDTEQLGKAVRKKRKQIGVTQRELAMTCGTGERFIVELEQGKQTCQVGKVLHVVQALGINISMDD